MFGKHGILGRLVVRHVVKGFKYEPEKYKVMKKMMAFHVLDLHPNKRIAISSNVHQVTNSC